MMSYKVGPSKVCVLYAALCGVALYNYLKVKDVRMSSQLPMDSLPERSTKVDI